MGTILCTGLIIVFIIAWFAAPLVVSHWQRSRLAAKWLEVADSYGFMVNADHKQHAVTMGGVLNGRNIQVQVRTIVTGGFKSYYLQFRFPTWHHQTDITVELKPKSLGSRLELRKHSLGASLGAKLLNDKDTYTKTGDAAFDKRFQITGDNAAFCEKALADPMIREGLIATRSSASITLVKDLDCITYSAKGMEANPETLTKLLTLLASWADKIEAINNA